MSRGTNARDEPEPSGSGSSARPPLVRELLLVAGFFLAYKAGRWPATGHAAEARRNGHDVWHLERALRLPDEGAVQSCCCTRTASCSSRTPTTRPSTSRPPRPS